MSIEHLALVRSVAARIAAAEPDAVRIVDRILTRLEIGRARYGDLDLARARDWRRERFEERLDALVYDVAEELALEDRALANLRDAARAEMLDEATELARWQERDHRTVASNEPARIAFEDVRELEPYDDFDTSDCGGEG